MIDFKYEKDLCAAFTETIPEDWEVYNEPPGSIWFWSIKQARRWGWKPS